MATHTTLQSLHTSLNAILQYHYFTVAITVYTCLEIFCPKCFSFGHWRIVTYYSTVFKNQATPTSFHNYIRARSARVVTVQVTVVHSCKSLVGHNTPVFRRSRDDLASAIKVAAGVNPLKNLYSYRISSSKISDDRNRNPGLYSRYMRALRGVSRIRPSAAALDYVFRRLDPHVKERIDREVLV